jgi:cyclic 2,3-diphosphoglycerate synthetase
MAEDGSARDAVVAAVAPHTRPGVPVVRAVLRPRPLESIAGERVAYFGTAPAHAHPTLARHLADEHEAVVTYVSGALSDRQALRTELENVTAETFVVELKAAAVDVVVEEALTRGARVVLAACDVRTLPQETQIDALVERLAGEAIAVKSGLRA